jgi:prephenate dehydratase
MAERVAFQGEFGAFSEMALRRACGAAAEALPCRTLRDVFQAVQGGSAALGVVPVENSRAGSIPETYDLLLEHALEVQGEVAIRVEQCLLAPKGTRLDAVRRVYSHPQALAQCETYIRGLRAEAVAVYDTAGSARSLAARAEPGAAAIASARAAELYGLDILARGIQEDPGNTTRFYVVARPGAAVPAAAGRPRTLLALALADDDAPGALFWSLGTLAFWRLNLTRVESRPSRKRPWHYTFYLELDGPADAPDCRAAVAELSARGAEVRVLGSFPAATLEQA